MKSYFDETSFCFLARIAASGVFVVSYSTSTVQHRIVPYGTLCKQTVVVIPFGALGCQHGASRP